MGSVSFTSPYLVPTSCPLIALIYALNNKLDKISMERMPKWKTSLGRLHQQFQTKKEVKDKTYNASTVSVYHITYFNTLFSFNVNLLLHVDSTILMLALLV